MKYLKVILTSLLILPLMSCAGNPDEKDVPAIDKNDLSQKIDPMDS